VAGLYRFDRFLLDPADRRLTENGQTVELSGRYLDALILLVAEQGRLVTRTRFLDEVWKGAPVTEEALTQCVRSLRKALGDHVGRPRFIETAPRHGYRFIAPVEEVARSALLAPGAASTPAGSQDEAASEATAPPPVKERFLGMGRAGLIGGGGAGAVGGLFYGLAGVTGGAGGAVSGLLVLTALTAVIGMIGGAGVGFGVGASAFVSRRTEPWLLIGGAGGGLVVGAVAQLVGLDAFTLLFGSRPAAMTGAGEGLLLGAAIGASIWITQARSQRTALLMGAVMTGFAGVVAALFGGRLMGGSLAALATGFPDAQLKLGALATVFGEATFGPLSQTVTAGLEGALFGAAMGLALSREHRRW